MMSSSAKSDQSVPRGLSQWRKSGNLSNGSIGSSGSGGGDLREKISNATSRVGNVFQRVRTTSSGTSGVAASTSAAPPRNISSSSGNNNTDIPYSYGSEEASRSNTSLPASIISEGGAEDGRRGSGAGLSRSSSGSSAKSKEKKSGAGKKKQKIARKLAKLAVYCQSAHFNGFESAKGEGKPYHVVSFPERTALPLSRQQRELFIDYHRRNLSRVYPAGFRVNSSNFDPLTFWAAGLQLVALNYQTPGRSMQINNAMFALNKGCGYVLKPSYMRSPGQTWVPKPRILTVEVISGQQLPKPKDSKRGEIIDPFVEVELITAESYADSNVSSGSYTSPHASSPLANSFSANMNSGSASTASNPSTRDRTVSGTEISAFPPLQQKYRTKTVVDNGFNPIFKGEKFKFRFSSPSELTFLRFEVYDEDVQTHDFIGSYCLALAALLPGYRHLPLNNWKGEPMLFGSLFIRSKIRDER